MTILSAVCGAIAGLTGFGLLVLIGTTVGLPSGPGWWVVGVPIIGLMALLAAKDR